MLQIMYSILRKFDTVYIYPIYNISLRKFAKILRFLLKKTLKKLVVKIVSAGGDSVQQQTISVIAHATTLQESWSFFWISPGSSLRVTRQTKEDPGDEVDTLSLGPV